MYHKKKTNKQTKSPKKIVSYSIKTFFSEQQSTMALLQTSIISEQWLIYSLLFLYSAILCQAINSQLVIVIICENFKIIVQLKASNRYSVQVATKQEFCVLLQTCFNHNKPMKISVLYCFSKGTGGSFSSSETFAPMFSPNQRDG